MQTFLPFLVLAAVLFALAEAQRGLDRSLLVTPLDGFGNFNGYDLGDYDYYRPYYGNGYGINRPYGQRLGRYNYRGRQLYGGRPGFYGGGRFGGAGYSPYYGRDLSYNARPAPFRPF